MKLSTMLQTAAASTALLVAAQAGATSITNTMTNTVTVANSCDVVAVGVNFGTITSPTALTLPVNTANTAADGGSAHDDTLGITTSVSALDTLIAPVLSAINVAVPGVFVACTTPPTSVTLGATTLSTSVGASAPVYTGNMTGPGGATIAYRLTMAGVVANTSLGTDPLVGVLPTFFTGVYAVGTSQITGSSGTILPGVYSETVTATVNY